MTSKRFIIADVFTNRRFGGNQLAVFLDGSGLEAETMQDIAREMNYSETTFLLPPADSGDYRVRIFTPGKELPFAGHPIVGSGHIIVAERMKDWSEPITTVTLEAGVGKLHVEVDMHGGRPGHTTMTQPLPQLKRTFNDIARVAKAVSLDVSDIERTGLPIEVLHNGITTVIVPVSSRSALERIKMDNGAIESLARDLEAETIALFTRETVDIDASVHCRVLAPGAGVGEDPATGSANGPLGTYMVKHQLVEIQQVTRIISEQGYEMHRPSNLHIEVDVEMKTHTITGVRVGGGVVITGRGEILLD
jgi:trans-2,3-dihydro-3-hydroxyanthranilate isomerase